MGSISINYKPIFMNPHIYMCIYQEESIFVNPDIVGVDIQFF